MKIIAVERYVVLIDQNGLLMVFNTRSNKQHFPVSRPSLKNLADKKITPEWQMKNE
jgi:hypothetical protein